MIPETTTVAETLKEVFTKLDSIIPTNNDGTSLLNAWKKLLGGTDRTEFEVLNSMSQILEALIKLESQIKNSQRTDDVTRKSALATTETFKALFSFQNFMQPASQFKSNCHPNSIGFLGMMGLGLKDEFSEPKLSKDDNVIIVNSLNEIKDLLRGEGVPIDLRVSLERHVDNILWWLSRPDIMSVQDIFERAGSATIVANQIEQRTACADDTKKSIGNKIRTQMVVVLEKIASVAGYIISNADKIEKIEQTYTKFLSGPPSS